MKYRINSVEEKLESAKVLLNAGKYRDSIGCSYYAISSGVWTESVLQRIMRTTLTFPL